MTTAVRTVEPTSDARTERYRAAERTLWSRYGLDPKERFVPIDDPRLRVRVVEVGSGDAVLFVPGTGGTGPYWAPLIRELRGFRSLMVDRPGWGLSDPLDWRNRDYGAAAATILARVLDDLAIERAHVVGASIGNLWALHLAHRYPDRVARVTLLGGHAADEVPIPKFIRLLRSPIGALIVRAPLSIGALRAQVSAVGHAASLDAGRLNDFLDWRLAFGKDTPSMRHERSMVQAVLGRDGWREGFVPSPKQLADIDHPTKMIFGSSDPTGSVEIWHAFVDQLPSGELQIVNGAGHMAWWDEPQAVGRSVASFLTSKPEVGATT